MRVPSDRAGSPDLGDELLAIAEDASSAGNVEIAIRVARLAAHCSPSQRSLTFLADRLASIGSASEVIRIYQYMIDVLGVPMDATIARALGYAEAEAGNFRKALDYFWRVIAIGGEDNELWFFIGTCYAMLREFAAANQIFTRNIVLQLSDGRTTSTAVLRLPSGPDAIRRVGDEELPFRRRLFLGPRVLAGDTAFKDADVIQLLCCDSRYFSLFARAVVQSIALRAGVRLGVHFHLVNSEPADQALFEELRMHSNVPMTYTTETVDFGELNPEQIRTYYTCARFLLLPELQALYTKPILITDADQTVIRSLGSFLETARAHDVGLLLFPRARYNLLALISASVCIANSTAGSRTFFGAVRNYILERVIDPAGLGWHLDQAALAASYLACQDVDFWLIPARTMVSKPLKPQVGQDTDEALFWSVTYSLESSAAKLDTREFLQFSGTSPTRS